MPSHTPSFSDSLLSHVAPASPATIVATILSSQPLHDTDDYPRAYSVQRVSE